MFFRKLINSFGSTRPSNRSTPSSPSRRQLRLEPLEDRRMLSITLFVDDTSTSATPDGLAWTSAYPDLQSALDQAAELNTDTIDENDVTQIWIAEGTYYPSAQLEPGDARSASFSLLDDVSLYGSFAGTETSLAERDLSAAHTTTLSGDLGVLDDNSDNAYTVVYCGGNTQAAIDGIWVVDGNANGIHDDDHLEKTSGGGIYSLGDLTITNSTVSGSSATGGDGSYFPVTYDSGDGCGGGIYNSGLLTVVNSTFSDNSAHGGDGNSGYGGGGGFGGGIYNIGELALTDSSFLSNSANGGAGQLSIMTMGFNGGNGFGGGIYNDGTLTLMNATLSDNSANGGIKTSGQRYSFGGGIYNNNEMTVSNSAFTNNAAISGAGIYNGSEIAICTSSFSKNTATDGGGIFNSGMLVVANSTLWDNSASSSGGGIFSSDTLTVTNCTILANSSRCGGGIFTSIDSLTTTLNNTIVAKNEASLDGPDLYNLEGTLSGSHNLIGDGSDQPTLADDADGNQVGSSSSPIDPLLSDYTQFDNGQWGYYLLPNSPALNAGNNCLALDPADQLLTEDIFGNVRITDGTVDIGAIEGVTTGNPAQTYLVESLESTIAEDGVLTFIEAFEAANRNQTVGDAAGGSFNEQDIIQFADGVSGTILFDESGAVILGKLAIEGPGADLMAFDIKGQQNGIFPTRLNTIVSLSGVNVGKEIHNNGHLTITNCLLSGNAGDSIDNRGILSVVNSVLSNNSGTGIRNSGILSVADSTLSGNSGNGICNTGSATITDCTLSENSSGGIYNSGDLIVMNCTLWDNSNGSGGGLYNSGTLTVANSIISNNSATGSDGGVISTSIFGVNSGYGTTGNSGYGGGVYNSGVLVITDSTLSRNSSSGGDGGNGYSDGYGSGPSGGGNGGNGYGGGIYNSGTLMISNSTISENSASGGNGGSGGSGTVTANGVVINDGGGGNGGCGSGGGIHSTGTLTISNSILSCNSVNGGNGGDANDIPFGNSNGGDSGSGYGGGIDSSGELTMVNSVVANNSTSGGNNGSGSLIAGQPTPIGDTPIVTPLPTVNLDYTFENSPNDSLNNSFGGGICITENSSIATLNNTIVSRNISNSGPDICLLDGTLSGAHNLIGNGFGQSLVHEVNGNLVGTSEFPIDPKFVDPANGDYRLIASSPAVNAGNNALAVDQEGQPLEVDLDGQPRIQGGAVDIGAYESDLQEWGHVRLKLRDRAGVEELTWMDEWTGCWVEVWGQGVAATGIGGFDVELEFMSGCFTPDMTKVVPGSDVDEETLSVTVEEGEGKLRVTGTTLTDGVGTGSSVMLAKIYFKPTPGNSVLDRDTDGHYLSPTQDAGFHITEAEILEHGTSAPHTSNIATQVAVPLWPVMYDLDGDGVINLSDVIQFISVYKMTTDENAPPMTWASDFDRSGVVNLRDFTQMLARFKWQKGDGNSISYPDEFPFTESGVDGEVDGSNVTILAGNWQYGTTAAAAASASASLCGTDAVFSDPSWDETDLTNKPASIAPQSSIVFQPPVDSGLGLATVKKRGATGLRQFVRPSIAAVDYLFSQ